METVHHRLDSGRLPRRAVSNSVSSAYSGVQSVWARTPPALPFLFGVTRGSRQPSGQTWQTLRDGGTDEVCASSHSSPCLASSCLASSCGPRRLSVLAVSASDISTVHHPHFTHLPTTSYSDSTRVANVHHRRRVRLSSETSFTLFPELTSSQSTPLDKKQ